LALLAVYVILGSTFSFAFGRKPGILPDNVVAELCPSIVVICVFLTTYSIYDVMSCGIAKAELWTSDKTYKDFPAKLSEKAFLAERAQMNQVEQLPSFLVATICFSVLVNGKVAGGLALVWAILRRLYAEKYRTSEGVPFRKKGIGAYTIPCYFILNTMLMGSAIHAIRWIIVGPS
jgi:uncharacterized MAPEG superfamily protein